jgi:hypothetical protein
MTDDTTETRQTAHGRDEHHPRCTPEGSRKNCSPHPTTRLSEAEREASGIDAMVLFECAGVVVALADAQPRWWVAGGRLEY